MMPLEQYLDDIVTKVGLLVGSEIPVDIKYIIHHVKVRIIAEALFRNSFVKDRAAKFLNTST